MTEDIQEQEKNIEPKIAASRSARNALHSNAGGPFWFSAPTRLFALAISLAIPIIFLALILPFGYFYIYSQINAPFGEENKSQEKIFTVEAGESSDKIAEKLESEKLIKNNLLFKFYVWDKEISDSLQAGKYLFSAGMSVGEIADAIVAGKVLKDETEIVIPEGFTITEIENRFIQRGLFADSKNKFTNLKARDFQDKFGFLASAPTGADLEGYLFPDTYFFKKEISLEDAALKMLANFNSKLDSESRAEIARQGKSIYEIITMASIIEREVRTEEDMKMVSGVLWKRIEIGMPMQADATVVYAVGHHNLSYDDLRVDSPYNTYIYKGLPKGPISNPGLQAIKAAIYPDKSDYLYYLSKPTGETVFSRTLNEHNIAKNKYLRND